MSSLRGYSSSSICPMCKLEVDLLEGKIFKGKCYHINCYEQLVEQSTGKEEKGKSEDEVALYKYVAKLFALPVVSVTLKKQISDYLTKGFTHLGMLRTLQYVYDLLQWDLPPNFDYPSLKVIEYKYEEAIEFWRKKESLAEKIKDFDLSTAVVEKQSKTRKHSKQEPTKELTYIDIDEAISQIENEKNNNVEDNTIQEYKKNVQEIKQEFERKIIGK